MAPLLCPSLRRQLIVILSSLHLRSVVQVAVDAAATDAQVRGYNPSRHGQEWGCAFTSASFLLLLPPIWATTMTAKQLAEPGTLVHIPPLRQVDKNRIFYKALYPEGGASGVYRTQPVVACCSHPQPLLGLSARRRRRCPHCPARDLPPRHLPPCHAPDVGESIVHYAKANAVDMLVLGARGLGSFKRWARAVGAGCQQAALAGGRRQERAVAARAAGTHGLRSIRRRRQGSRRVGWDGLETGAVAASPPQPVRHACCAPLAVPSCLLWAWAPSPTTACTTHPGGWRCKDEGQAAWARGLWQSSPPPPYTPPPPTPPHNHYKCTVLW